MEKITDINQCNKLQDNVVWIEPNNSLIVNSNISFEGKNNVLFIEDGVTLCDSNIMFRGDNSVVYLSKNCHKYFLSCHIFSHSCIFFGMNCYMSNNYLKGLMTLYAAEGQNIIVGRDGLFSYNVIIRTTDHHSVYDCYSKTRSNFSKSIIIGDHVWIGEGALILKGCKIGSGAIIGEKSVLANKTIASNTAVAGNPVKTIKNNIFFTKNCVQNYNSYETKTSEIYEGDEFIFSQSGDIINMDNIDILIKNENDSVEKLKIIKMFLCGYGNKNRFYLS